MEPFMFVLAWLGYVALFGLAVVFFDRHQREFLRRLYARGRNFATPQ